MFDEKTQQPHTAHTCAPVPCIYVGRPAKVARIVGTLSDIAPTILYLMDLPQPQEMTGHRLFDLQ
jgi:2,3-bisphosphoglycerate-independent phosphoglycerate mutase